MLLRQAPSVHSAGGAQELLPFKSRECAGVALLEAPQRSVGVGKRTKYWAQVALHVTAEKV